MGMDAGDMRERMQKRIAELEAALRDCIEIAGSDCEREACKLVIERASKLVQLRDPRCG